MYAVRADALTKMLDFASHELKFRGPNSWPLFRSYRPGYHPWYLTSKEAKYLTVALRQAIDVSLRFKNDPEMLTPPMRNQYLVRVPKKEKDGLRWRDKWLEPLPLKKRELLQNPSMQIVWKKSRE
ncbi:MAG: hypothetical protein J7J73_01200 [Deltaproteobacteria bacterium]|nr:hypothetical protein [Deltaproteobacteria bacterium]